LTAVKAVLYTADTRLATAVGHVNVQTKGSEMSSPPTGARQRAMRLPLLAVIGIVTSVVGFARFRGHRKTRRPTGTELMQMSDADFAAFIHESGLKTVTSAGLSADGHSD
jgi:hypothetical protein